MRYVLKPKTIKLRATRLVGWRMPMRLRTTGVIAILALGVLGKPLPAGAEQAGKVYRVGYLSRGDTIPEVFKQELRELGYVEGENIVYLVGKATGIKGRAAELVRLKVDVIATRGTPGAQAAKEATSTIPIVMHAGANPVQSGLVASLARPGGNITGLTAGIGRGLYEKHLELLKEVVPKLSRVAALWNLPLELLPIQKSFEHTAGLLGLKVQSLEVRSPDDLESAFQAAIEEGAQGLIIFRNQPLLRERKRIIAWATKSRLPAIAADRRFASEGGLMSYGIDLDDTSRRHAIYVDKILKGASPATLPIERTEKLELIINLKTAKKMGLIVPSSVLYQAAKVIK